MRCEAAPPATRRSPLGGARVCRSSNVDRSCVYFSLRCGRTPSSTPTGCCCGAGAIRRRGVRRDQRRPGGHALHRRRNAADAGAQRRADRPVRVRVDEHGSACGPSKSAAPIRTHRCSASAGSACRVPPEVLPAVEVGWRLARHAGGAASRPRPRGPRSLRLRPARDARDHLDRPPGQRPLAARLRQAGDEPAPPPPAPGDAPAAQRVRDRRVRATLRSAASLGDDRLRRGRFRRDGCEPRSRRPRKTPGKPYVRTLTSTPSPLSH